MQTLLQDECHLAIFAHPPREGQALKVAQGVRTFVFNAHKLAKTSSPLYVPTAADEKRYAFDEKRDGFVRALVEEAVRNGFRNDLCRECRQGVEGDECACSDFPSLLAAVDEKMGARRHVQMGSPLRRDHMLALLMYTGCECNYELCAAQRSGDFLKWKWLDLTLFKAICRLSVREKGSYKLYSGLRHRKLHVPAVERAFFATYTSTTWRRDIALRFAADGMMLEFEARFRSDRKSQCCDVSWISKFGADECEVLIARSVQYRVDKYDHVFSLRVLDEVDGVQRVLVSKQLSGAGRDDKLKAVQSQALDDESYVPCFAIEEAAEMRARAFQMRAQPHLCEERLAALSG